MKPILRHTYLPEPQKRLTGLTLAVLILAAASPAYAAPRDDDRDWNRHEVRAHRYWGGRPEPRVVYAPPVVYEPPPVVESPGLNLIIPLNIR